MADCREFEQLFDKFCSEITKVERMQWLNKAEDDDVWHIAEGTNGVYTPLGDTDGYYGIHCINGDSWDFRCSTLNLSDFFDVHLPIMKRCATEFAQLKHKYIEELESH